MTRTATTVPAALRRAATGWRGPVRAAGLLGSLLLCSTVSAKGESIRIPASEVREAARLVAAWAAERQRADALATAIDLAVAAGASRDPDDPWSVADLARQLAALPGGADLPAEGGGRIARGVMAGVSRLDVTLAPGSAETVALTMAAGEPAVVEARLKRGSRGADLDLRLEGGDGRVLEDTGAQTGVPGVGAYLELVPETCLDVVVEIRNVGHAPARAVMLAPASSRLSCEG